MFSYVNNQCSALLILRKLSNLLKDNLLKSMISFNELIQTELYKNRNTIFHKHNKNIFAYNQKLKTLND